MKHTKTEYLCDIKDCQEQACNHFIEQRIHVVFTTEQTEGRVTPPYLEPVTLDLCRAHADEILKKRKMVTAYGAQGNNTYYFE